MNTTGIQNYLSNVFRPIYTYDTTTLNFTPRLEMSNIDVYSGNTVSVFTAAVGDSNSNVYVGSNSGNPYNITRACRNVTALGVGAASNISNCSNSVYLGSDAGLGSSNNQSVISIGYQAGLGGTGVSNIFVGTNATTTVGSSNIFLGHGLSLSNVSNQVRIGLGNQIPIAADLSLGWVGLGGPLSPSNANNKLDISGNTQIQGQLGVNILPGGRTLDVNGNFRATDASGNILDFSNGFTRSTGGFMSSNGSVLSGGTGVPVPIGTIRKGIINVSAVNRASATNRAAYIFFAYTTSNVTPMSSTSNGNTNIITNSTNIQLDTSSVATYDYSITYFPMP